MQYKAYLKQFGEGCDYTIGCAQTVISLEADNMEDAIIKLEEEIAEYYGDETELESAELYEVNKTIVMPISDIYKKRDKKISENEKSEKLKADKAEYERLKKQFE